MTIPFKKCSVFDQCLHCSLCLCPSAENKATLCYHKQDFLMTEFNLFSKKDLCHSFTAMDKQL